MYKIKMFDCLQFELFVVLSIIQTLVKSIIQFGFLYLESPRVHCCRINLQYTN